ncbi:hypothetical protein DPEC_G00029480 [Dallia pectoralis]|uniref:Uncharacterized protein n=1 Tax=Dallia pectoralis TaxID=75939 RepID=A0ACC2HID2_DALPE|nr:hypothetical protein DPEC_G00029480 [Dallia pectoralis]
MMESGGVSSLTEECLLQATPTCLGCFIEPRDPAPIHDHTTSDLGLEAGLVGRHDFEATSCPISDISSISIQCLGQSGDVVGVVGQLLGEQLLSEQLLSFPLTKPSQALALVADKMGDEEKATGHSGNLEEDTPSNLYEGLLLDKVNGEEVLLLDKVNGEEVLLLDKVSGEEVLLANAGQDWGYFESFISESKMELLDLCSKTDLSVNLFSEDDVDNLFDDEDEDSTLSSDVCSLKIRYESFQDNMREKTNVLQEETQFNFFPSVLINCTKREDGVEMRRQTSEEGKAEELSLLMGQEEIKEGVEGRGERPQIPPASPLSSPSVNYLIEFSNSAEEDGEYSDTSSCTSSDTLQDTDPEGGTSHGPRKLLPPSPLNYGLRSKRKVRYSDDYLYDVDSIDSNERGANERNEKTLTKKKEKVPAGQREKEEDVDWCPKKRRKSSRKEPTPVVIKYIIINRFKGERRMAVKLGRLDPAGDVTVNLDADAEKRYSSLSPLKDFWRRRRREREVLAAGDKQQRPKRKYKTANRLRVQRVQNSSVCASTQAVTSAEGVGCTGGGETATSDPQYQTTKKSRTQEREEREKRRTGGKTGKIRKFKSEARLRSTGTMEGVVEEGGRGGEGGGNGMNGLMQICPVAAGVLLVTNQEPAGGVGGAELSSNTGSPSCFSLNHSSQQPFPFTSADKSVTSGGVEREEGVSVIQGGYLQTLLDASDSTGGAGIHYYPQPASSESYTLSLPLEDKQFSLLQLPQSCVLSPPSESELQQSPENQPSFPNSLWHHQAPVCLGHSNTQRGFISVPTDTPETPLLPCGFPGTLTGGLSGSVYSQLESDTNRLMYDKSYLGEGEGVGLQMKLGVELQQLQVCEPGGGVGEGQEGRYQRGSLCSDHGRLISYDSVGSLSACSSNYSPLSRHSCSGVGGEKREGGGETEEGSDSYLQHCSPTVVFQQRLEGMDHPLTPLRESSDLLDISNFTPDKFRHSSLSELSPPETPNLSPEVTGGRGALLRVGKAPEYQDHVTGCEVGREGKWNCDVIQQAGQPGSGGVGYGVEGDQFQTHPSFNGEDQQAQEEEEEALKNTRSKRKGGSKQAAARGQGPKKGRAPRAAKTPRQSRSSKKIKAMLEGKAAKGQLGGNLQPHSNGSTGDWSGSGIGDWSETNNSLGGGDEQREFGEPSNILSNIVSGMAEVQRFMMASIEPLWVPLEADLSADANSLNMKTIQILQGPEPLDGKGGKKGAGGAGRGRKAGGKASKNQAKFNPSHPIFPQLALGCNMFDKPNFINPGPAHKKLYRHKTSAKFPRLDTVKGKRNKDLAVMATSEKLRQNMAVWLSLSFIHCLVQFKREPYNP